MPICAGVNFTDADLAYYRKIQSEKSWAWWVNILGKKSKSTTRDILER
jgi:hypothetical protein